MRYVVASFIVATAIVVTGCQPSHRHQNHRNYEELHLVDVPQAVRESFDRDYPGATLEEVGREVWTDGATHYHLKFRTAMGQKQDIEYTSSGERLAQHR